MNPKFEDRSWHLTQGPSELGAEKVDSHFVHSGLVDHMLRDVTNRLAAHPRVNVLDLGEGDDCTGWEAAFEDGKELVLLNALGCGEEATWGYTDLQGLTRPAVALALLEYLAEAFPGVYLLDDDGILYTSEGFRRTWCTNSASQ